VEDFADKRWNVNMFEATWFKRLGCE